MLDYSTCINVEEKGMPSHKVPDIVVGRLPLYLRSLTQMANEGKEITSSQELGGRLGISSAQIRKDLSQFGEFGKQGTGYNVSFLTKQLRQILKVEDVWEVVLIGAGDLGRAVANYGGFVERGFQIAAVYDNDPNKVGSSISNFTVRDMNSLEEEVSRINIKVAMLAVPAEYAQEVSEQLILAGIEAILCYAPTPLQLPPEVRVEYIDPVLHLQHMTYYVSKD
jgi:redox-sensing transcriptional repressor